MPFPCCMTGDDLLSLLAIVGLLALFMLALVMVLPGK